MATPKRGNSRTRLGAPGRSGPIRIDFDTLQATVGIMDPEDGEYQPSVHIFLSSRYQAMSDMHRQYKNSQLVTKEMWMQFWTGDCEESQRITPAVADKIFHTCQFLAKGKRGMTPTEVDRLRTALSREYAKVTSSDRGQQQKLMRYSWFGTDEQRRDISRSSQVLTPQKYEEMIARYKAETARTNEEIQRENAGHARTMEELRGKLRRAKETITRLKAELTEAQGAAA